MLKAHIRLSDTAAPIGQNGNTLNLGCSFVERFRSEQLVSEHRCGKFVWVGEVADPFPHELDSGERYRRFVDFEGVKIFLKQEACGNSISVVRTACAGSPMYVSFEHDTLTLSWDFSYVASKLATKIPNKEACRIYILEGEGQVREQVIKGIYMLWPGETVEVSASGIKFTGIDPLPIVQQAAIHESARVTDEFLKLIGEIIGPSLKRSQSPVLEISGGLDSSVIGVAAANNKKGISSYAVIHDGPMGVQQVKRRKEICDLLGLSDHTGPSYEINPFASLNAEDVRHTPLDDMYRVACVNAYDSHPNGPFDLVLTGIGGDELVKENSFLRRDWEVAGNISSSSLVATAGRSDMFMRRGAWVKSAMTHQRVVDFCRAIPSKMKERRLIHRYSLVRAGLSDGFLYPRYYEHYGHVFNRYVYLTDFDDMLPESIVADYGIFDVNRLLVEAREAMVKGFSDELKMQLFSLIKLERVLSKFVL